MVLIEEEEDKEKWTFFPIKKPYFPGFEDPDAIQLLRKWGIDETASRLMKFSYDQYVAPIDIPEFLLYFFNDPRVTSTVEILNASLKWDQLPVNIKELEISKLNTSIISLDFFDRLETSGIVRSQSGRIVKCMPRLECGFEITDKVHDMLVNTHSENFDLYTKQEKNEVIFILFRHLALGGTVCQYEDEIKPYFNVLTKIYKDLIKVSKNSVGAVDVMSIVYKVESFGSNNSNSNNLFPRKSSNNVCLVSIDPIKRHLTMYYFAYVPW